MGAIITDDGAEFTGRALTGWTASRPTSTVTHNIVGRADPIAVLGTMASRSGVLTIRCFDGSDAERLVHHMRNTVCTLHTPEHPSISGMRFVAMNFDYEPTERVAAGWVWELRVDYVEVS